MSLLCCEVSGSCQEICLLWGPTSLIYGLTAMDAFAHVNWHLCVLCGASPLQHCDVMGNCIGLRNHRFFVAFLVSAQAGCLLMMVRGWPGCACGYAARGCAVPMLEGSRAGCVVKNCRPGHCRHACLSVTACNWFLACIHASRGERCGGSTRSDFPASECFRSEVMYCRNARSAFIHNHDSSSVVLTTSFMQVHICASRLCICSFLSLVDDRCCGLA